MITLYWVYNLPNWIFGLFCVAAFAGYGLAGLPLTRKLVKRVHREDHSHNDVVSYYLAAVTVFYGITLGLVAIGTWTNYSNVQDRVDHEAQTLASLYRDANCYPEPARTILTNDLKLYTREVIDRSWPLQRQGIMPTGTNKMMDKFQMDLIQFAPRDVREQIFHAETFRQFNVFVEARRARLDSIYMNLPRALWWMVILGSLICISITFFFDLRSQSMHRWMTGAMSALLGLMIFLVATLDNPFRGKVAIGPDSIERVYDTLMK